MSYRGTRFTNAEVAQDYIRRLQHKGKERWITAEARILKLMEEAGEVQKVFNRLHGYARKTDTLEHEAEELADVVICAYALALVEGIDLDNAIHRKRAVLMTQELNGKEEAT